MDENMKEILDEATESPEEEVTEEIEQIEADEEAFEDYSDEEEDSSEAEKYVMVAKLARELKKAKTQRNLFAVTATLLFVVIAVFAGVKCFNMIYNPYNHMGYMNFSGMTLEDFAKTNGVSVEEVKAVYNLPNDMKDDTYWDAAEMLMPLYTFEHNSGVTFEEIKVAFGFTEDVKRDDTYGEAYDKMPLSKVIGEGEEFSAFVEEYGFDESVTPQTTWGKVRAKVEKQDYDKMLAENAMADMIGEIPTEATEY